MLDAPGAGLGHARSSGSPARSAWARSTAAAALRRLGIPVHDADAAVHRLLATDGAAIAAVEAAFPGVDRTDGAVDRAGARPPRVRRSGGVAPAGGDHPSAASAGSEIALSAARRAPRAARWSCSTSRCCSKPAASARCDATMVVSAPRFVQAAAGAAPARHDPRSGLRRFARARSPDAEKRGAPTSSCRPGLTAARLCDSRWPSPWSDLHSAAARLRRVRVNKELETSHARNRARYRNHRPRSRRRRTASSRSPAWS